MFSIFFFSVCALLSVEQCDAHLKLHKSRKCATKIKQEIEKKKKQTNETSPMETETYTEKCQCSTRNHGKWMECAYVAWKCVYTLWLWVVSHARKFFRLHSTMIKGLSELRFGQTQSRGENDKLGIKNWEYKRIEWVSQQWIVQRERKSVTEKERQEKKIVRKLNICKTSGGFWLFAYDANCCAVVNKSIFKHTHTHAQLPKNKQLSARKSHCKFLKWFMSLLLCRFVMRFLVVAVWFSLGYVLFFALLFIRYCCGTLLFGNDKKRSASA